MTENDKVIVPVPEKQKIEIPISIYLLIFLQMILLAFIGFTCVELTEICYALFALNMGVL